MLAMKPSPGLRLTLVSDTAFAPYSGMLPGLVAGHYQFSDAHIDLRRFCSSRGVRFVEAAICGIDPASRQLLLEDRPPIRYDLLSINVGAQPELDSVPGAREHAVPVKPVGTFYQRWLQLQARLEASGNAKPRVLLVGGGAGSLELALAIRQRLGPAPAISLLCGETLLSGYNARARSAVRQACRELDVDVLESARVSQVVAEQVSLEDGSTVDYDLLVWCTGVVPAAWLKETGLALDDRGFLQVDDSLRVLDTEGVFAAGDVAVQVRNPRPRAGVFAVRQAPVLAHNLAAAAEGRPLKEHRPQRRFLSLLSLGERRAVADKGPFSARGEWVWRWKDSIDRRFMDQFVEKPPPMPMQTATAEMRCGGCGAKLPADLLRQALATVAEDFPRVVDIDDLRDDAALLELPGEARLLQTVDTLRQLVDDPWLMGRVAALHALSDLYAMGATPHSVQLHICLPYGAPGLQQRDLVQLMSGVAVELDRASCRLVGGHSMEGPELSVGLTANGIAPSEGEFNKQGARDGDRLILTKALGTGVIFAAAMEGLANGDSLAAAIDSMLRSNRDAAEIAAGVGVHACTDLTGFGLAGHLLEMLGADQAARLAMQDLPLLEGAAALWESGQRSTLHDGNVASAGGLDLPPACFDPQTSGGLLLAVPGEKAGVLLSALQDSGHVAAIVGEVAWRAEGDAPISAL